jgi:hypothetical protein
MPPDTINWYYADTATGLIFNEKCTTNQATLLPFMQNGVLPEVVFCGPPESLDNNNLERTLQKGLKNIFDIFR